MTETRCYRRLAAVVLLWGILPLPFLYIVQPPFWMVAAGAAGWLLLTPDRAFELSRVAQNLLGLLILVAVATAGGAGVGPLRPLGHLLLLLASVRLVEVRDRRGFLRLLPVLVLVWVVAVASSTHIAIVAYFAGSAFLWWWVGMEVNLLGVIGRAPPTAVPMVRPRHAIVAASVALGLAAPVFVGMPRLRSPWVAGRGGAQSVTGFRSRVQLSGVGAIRRSEEVALTVHVPSGEEMQRQWSRLRATALEQVTADSWAPRRAGDLPVREDGVIWLHGRRSLAAAVPLDITVLRPSRYLFVPTAALAVRAPQPLRVDPAGGLMMAGEPGGALTYRVWVSRGGEVRFADPPRPRDRRVPAGSRVESLARRIVEGRTTTEDRAAAVEAYLRHNYRYSLRGMGAIGPDPIQWFLLDSREGHCEYFAGGMVVLLEAVGVPARMVAGYSGGDLDPGGGELTVRQANAHTWVEVWLGPGRGWEVFDPTPAAGVPGFGAGTRGLGLRGVWDGVETAWDRYVLTYGLGEQVLLLSGLGGVLAVLSRAIPAALTAAVCSVLMALGWGLRARRRRSSRPRRRRRDFPAARAVEQLSRRLERVGVEVPPWATARWVGARAAARWPDAAGELSVLVDRAENELYSEGGWRRSDPAAVHRQWALLRRRLRAAERS